MKSQELHDKRSQALADAKKINDLAGKEGRVMTSEETANFDKAFAEAESWKDQAERALKLEHEERDLDKPVRPEVSTVGREPDPADEPTHRTKFGTPEYRTAFREYLLGRRGMEEMRALQIDSDIAGGYITAEEQFVNELIKDLDDEVQIRGWARKFTVAKAQSLGAPKRTAKMSTFAWGSEIGTPTADTALTFGKRNLHPHPATGEILVSRDLMRQATMGPEAIVRAELVRDAGELQENAFLTGNGSQQPLGLFTASSDGISTGRDVSTGNTNSSITFDGLKEAKYNQKGSYRRNSQWLFHRDGVKQIAKLKDGEGQYLWAESVRVGEPDMLLGRPAFDSEFAPNTFTSGLYVGLFGDLSFYWIADALDMEIQILTELHARTFQVGFIARFKTDGAPVVEEAFTRVKLA